ncbi:MAG: hypothetical protein K1Y02_16630 [Candidatus Hydrogenedentes bacterium]|nr:hypothetical protein [Candidatus Hydrogenedentota bacterium]
MEAFIAHLQENWMGYTILLVLLLPFVYVFRRVAVPAIQWAIELCVYSTIFHIVMHFLMSVIRWFRVESQMKWRADERVDPGWQTPLVNFWDTELYKPGWVFYFEVAMVVVFFLLMIRYRPMKTQRPGPKRDTLRKGQVPKLRPPGSSVKPKGK